MQLKNWGISMRLINADKIMDKMESSLDMQELYLPIHLKELIIDEMPTIESIPKEKIDQAIEKINRVARSGQFNDAVCFGLTHAIFILKNMIVEEAGE